MDKSPEDYMKDPRADDSFNKKKYDHYDFGMKRKIIPGYERLNVVDISENFIKNIVNTFMSNCVLGIISDIQNYKITMESFNEYRFLVSSLLRILIEIPKTPDREITDEQITWLKEALE